MMLLAGKTAPFGTVACGFVAAEPIPSSQQQLNATGPAGRWPRHKRERKSCRYGWKGRCVELG